MLFCSMFCCLLFTGLFVFFFFKQKTAYEMRISDWSSDVCSSDLLGIALLGVIAVNVWADGQRDLSAHYDEAAPVIALPEPWEGIPAALKIGRASCRERVCQYV